MTVHYFQPDGITSRNGHVHITENHPDPSPESNVDCRAMFEIPNHETFRDLLTSPLSETNNLATTCYSDVYSSEAVFASSETIAHSPKTTTSEDITPAEGLESTSRAGSPTRREQPEPSAPGRLPLKESLGRTGSATIFGGSVLILASMAFLSLLWFGYGDEPEAASAPWIWRQIAVHDWMTRTITISALVLRSVVSLQVALCTSMTAALILEKRQTRKSNAAYLSIARSISDGPRQVIQLVLSSRSWSVLTYVELWLLCLLALVMLVLQFSSTLLLSDIHNFVIVGDVTNKTVTNFGTFTGINDIRAATASLSVGNPLYAIFGEERLSSNITPDASGFSDTGTIRRGYLPFQGSENRTSVRKYRGPTLVTNSRTVCVPPQIKGYFLPPGEDDGYYELGHIVGIIDYGESIRRAHDGIGPLCLHHRCEIVQFDCSVPGSTLDNGSSQSNFCYIETVGHNSLYISSALYDEPFPYLYTGGEPWSLNSTMFLVFRSGLTAPDWTEIVDPYPIPPANATGEWSRFEILGGRSVDVSLCFTRFYVQPQYVNMIAHKPTREPVVVWDGFALEHNTTAVSASFSIESPPIPPSDRGLIDMDVLPNPDTSITDIEGLDALTPDRRTTAVFQRFVLGVTTNNLYPGPFSGCVFCSDYSFPTSVEFSLVFTDIVESTGRAAPAMQTFIALSAARAYDTLLKAFNVTGVVELSTTTSARTPGPCSEHSCSGFITVMTLLSVHLVMVMVTTALFVAQVRYSRCSNTWHAVAQLIGAELEDVLDKSNNAKDRLITKALEHDGKDDFVKLGVTRGSGRVQILKHSGGSQNQGTK